MPDEISQAAESEQVSLEEAQVPESEVADATTPEEPQTEKPLTAEDYRRIAREEATRVAQSQTAKSENRIQKFIQDQFKALDMNKSVLNLTDEQVKQARKEIVAQAYEQPVEDATTNALQPDPLVSQQVELVHNQIALALQKYGVDSITANDPEFKILDEAFNDPNGSLADVIIAASKAGEAKQRRLAQKKETAKTRVSGGGEQGSNSNKPMTAEEKISAGLKKSSWPTQTPQK